MHTNTTQGLTLEDFLLFKRQDLHHFEQFFETVGFKRIDGSVFGLLTFSEKGLTSEELQTILGISQGAISLALKNLTAIGAITSQEYINNKTKIHCVKSNALSIVASVLKKREYEMIKDFQMALERALKNPKAQTGLHHKARSERILSMSKACDLGLAMMELVFESEELRKQNFYKHVVDELPKILENRAMDFLKVKELVLGKISEKFPSTAQRPKDN